MAADPSSFDYYRRGQPLDTEKGRPDNSGFDYYRRGQPLIGLVKASTYTLTCATGSFILTGQAVGLTVARKLTASTGTFVLTGNTVSLIVSRKLSAGTGSFLLSGSDVGLIVSKVLTVETGSFVLTGNDANFLVQRVLSAETGVFILSGSDVQLTFAAFYFLIAETGVFLLVGNDVALTVNIPVPPEPPAHIGSGGGGRASDISVKHYPKEKSIREKEKIEREKYLELIWEQEDEEILAIIAAFVISNN